MKMQTCLLVAATLLSAVPPAAADILKIGSRAALAGNVVIDWHRFGPDNSTVSTPLSRRFGPLRVGVGSSSGTLLIRREGTTWHGDFKPGQFLMTQPYQSDSFLVSFSPPVSAVGTQIDPGHQEAGNPPYTGRFVAKLCLYDRRGAFLGEVATAGTASAAEDGSARFIGARSTGEPIGYVSLLVSGVTPGFTVEGDLAANQMDVLVPDVSPYAIPASLPAASGSRGCK